MHVIWKVSSPIVFVFVQSSNPVRRGGEAKSDTFLRYYMYEFLVICARLS